VKGSEKTIINAAIAFIDQLNSFNSTLHPEVIKRTKELQTAVGAYWKEYYWKEDEKTGGFKENSFTSLHRCEWCGEEIVQIPVSIGNYKEFSVVCAKCLKWRRDGGKVVITELRNVRPGSVLMTDECNPLQDVVATLYSNREIRRKI
jgi:hypothetical protein